jgi:sugar lactone lactonase YvrE
MIITLLTTIRTSRFCRGGLSPLIILLVSIASVRADLFVTDSNGVSRYDTTTNTVTTDFIPLNDATGLTFGSDGLLYVATTNPGLAPGTGSVYRYDSTTGAQVGGPFVVYNGMPPTPDPRDVINPAAMRFGSTGDLFIADTGVSNVHIYSPTGMSLGALTDPTMTQPIGLAFDPSGRLYVTAAGEVLRYDFGTATFSNFANPVNPIDIEVASNGEVYVLDANTGVLAYNSSGMLDRTVVDFSTSFFFAKGLTIGADGEVYVSGSDSNSPSPSGEVLRYKTDGTPDGTFVAGLPDDAGFMTFSPVQAPPTNGVPESGGTITLMLMSLGPLVAFRFTKKLRR